MYHAEKTLIEESTTPPSWEVTKPVPLEECGSLEAVTGLKNPNVHYIYVCTKVSGPLQFT